MITNHDINVMQAYTFESISAIPINKYFTQLYVIISHCLSILIDIAYLIRLFSFSFFSVSLHQPLHILCNLLVGDLGVDLRAGNRRMPHHLSDALDRHTGL